MLLNLTKLIEDNLLRLSSIANIANLESIEENRLDFLKAFLLINLIILLKTIKKIAS